MIEALDHAAPAIAMLAAFALLIAGLRRMWKGTDRRKGGLMLVMALVLLVNVAIWTW